MSGNRPVPPPDYPKPQPAPNSARYELVEPTGLQGTPFPQASPMVDGAPVSVSPEQLGQPAPAYSQEVSVDHVPPPPPPVSPPPESPSNDALAQGLDIARPGHADMQSPHDAYLALDVARAAVEVLPLAVALFHLISNLEADDEQALSQRIVQASNGQRPPPPPPTPAPKPPKQSPVLESTEPVACGPEGHPPPPPPTAPPKPPKSKSLDPECDLSLQVTHGPVVWGSGPPKPKYSDTLLALSASRIVQAAGGHQPPPPPPTPPPKAPKQSPVLESTEPSACGPEGHPPPPPPTAPPKPPKSKSLVPECGLSLQVTHGPVVWGSGGHSLPAPKYGDTLALSASSIVQAANGQHPPPPPPTPPPKAPKQAPNGQHPPPPPPTPPPKAPNQKQMGSGPGGNPPPPPPTPPPKAPKTSQLGRIQPLDGHAPKPVPPVPQPDPVPAPRSLQTCAAELGSLGPVCAFSTVALVF